MTRGIAKAAPVVLIAAGAAAAFTLGALSFTRPTSAAPTAGTATAARLAHARAQARVQRARADHLQLLLTRRVRQDRALRATLAHRTSTLEALRLAALATSTDPAEQTAMYETLYRIAACESTGTAPAPWPASTRALDAAARNPRAEARSGEHAVGLLQFLPSTWLTTPYGQLAITSPYAQALAAAWMIRHGRMGEWACAWSAR